MHVVCPACMAKNRLPEQRRQENPQCGQCHQPLFPGVPIELNDQNLATYLSGNDQPVLIDFWAAWCGPCRMMAPHFKSIAEQRYDVHCVKVDTDANPISAQKFAIRSIPTLILCKGGQEKARQSGVLSAPQLSSWIDQNLLIVSDILAGWRGFL